MKNIFKTVIALFLISGVISCSDQDKDPVAQANGFTLNTPEQGTQFVLTPTDAANELLTLTWGESNNGVASVSDYTIEIAKSGTNFANPVNAVLDADVITNRTYSWTVGYLNELINQVGFTPCQSVDIDVRVKSTLGLVPAKAFVQYSNVVTLNVTPYLTDLPLMAFSSSNVITASTGKMAASGILNTDYEGYMYLEPGTYKFY
ncbi:MAG TPA: SusE domain-containing protein, partial [Flavobacterium sp.]|nr:SusE domain-containing protein [Flavobacterium sp.]